MNNAAEPRQTPPRSDPQICPFCSSTASNLDMSNRWANICSSCGKKYKRKYAWKRTQEGIALYPSSEYYGFYTLNAGLPADCDTWANHRDTVNADTATNGYFYSYLLNNQSKLWAVYRIAIQFNTKKIPNGITISSATLTVSGYDYIENFVADPEINLYKFTPSAKGLWTSNNEVVVSDYDIATKWGIPIATGIPFSSINGSDITWTLNSDGLAYLNRTGYTNIGILFNWDYNDAYPVQRFNYDRARVSDVTYRDIKLSIVY